MRALELIAGLLSLCGLWAWVQPLTARLWLRPLGGVLLCVIVAHCVLEGWRWQAVPLYAAGILLAGLADYPRWSSSLAALVGSAGLVLCYALPVFALERPTGPYRIGARSLYFSDEGRVEKHGGGARRIAIEVWYPTQPDAQGPKSPYRDPRTLLPRSAHHRWVQTNSIRNAPPLEQAGGWPIVFFSPSSGGHRTQNTFLCEELASHGYVVVGVDHPYSSSRVAFPEGTVIYSLPTDWLQIGTQASWKASLPVVEETLQTRAADVLSAWRELEKDRSLPIDFQKAAVIGHSFGGAVAAELCRKDRRFQTGANLDGWMFAAVQKEGVAPNFLFAIEDDVLWGRNEGPFTDDYSGNARRGTKDYHDTIRRSLRRFGGYLWRPPGARHGDFADLSLYTRWPFPGQQWGNEARVRRLHGQTREIVLALMNRHLKGLAAPILDGLAQAQEAI